jgi:C1A family cysteine protease
MSLFLDVDNLDTSIDEDNENKIFCCDIIPSSIDIRDWSADSIFSSKITIPSKFDFREILLPVRNQGTINASGACVGATIKEWQEFYNIGFYGYMSPTFLYNNRTNQDGTYMSGREIMKILKNHGSCREMLYSKDNIQDIQDISPEVYKEANNFRIKAYARVYTVNTLKTALLKNGPCFISFPVFNESKNLWKAKTGERQKGGTAMTVVGYNEKGFILRNSWGVKWGKNGYCTYPYEDWGSHFEIWTTIDDTSSNIDEKPKSIIGKSLYTMKKRLLHDIVKKNLFKELIPKTKAFFTKKKKSETEELTTTNSVIRTPTNTTIHLQI